MAEKTANYGLTKPNPEDFYDVGVQNANMDKIDEELKKRATLGEDGKIPKEQIPESDPTISVDDIEGVLPLTKGGTGATSAAAARSAIQAAKNVHKHNASDIDSGTLSSDRLPVLPITKGGTGASNSSQARANLGITEEYWTFTLEDGQTVTKLVCAT
jgi:hypothetical protein